MEKNLLIEKMLQEKNMSFSRLSELTKIKRTTLLYGLNSNKINIKYLSKIAEVLECNVADLIPDEVAKVNIDGLFRYNGRSYDFSDLNDFVDFTNILLTECNIQSDLYYMTENLNVENI